MKSIVMLIVGVLGLASVAGVGYLLAVDNGLAAGLKQRDTQLQALPEDTRRQILEEWSRSVKQRAESAPTRDNVLPSPKDVFGQITSGLTDAETRLKRAIDAWQNDPSAENQNAINHSLEEAEKQVAESEGVVQKADEPARSETSEKAFNLTSALQEQLNRVAKEAQDPAMQEKARNLLERIQKLQPAESTEPK